MPPKTHVSPGDKFGLLTIVEEAESGRTPKGRPYRRFRCQCDCGSEVIVYLSKLASNHTKSCGCLRYKHGYGNDRRSTYIIWQGMHWRCSNPSNTAYEHYGGRGIKVCERWNEFLAFLEDMGEQPEGLSIDRYPDNNGDYEPGNCRWASPSEQNRNKRSNHMLTHNGESLCLEDWAERTGIQNSTIRMRLKSGYSAEEALTLPVGGKRR